MQPPPQEQPLDLVAMEKRVSDVTPFCCPRVNPATTSIQHESYILRLASARFLGTLAVRAAVAGAAGRRLAFAGALRTSTALFGRRGSRTALAVCTRYKRG